MKVTFVQKEYDLGHKAKNIEIMKEELESSESDLLIFPEMFLTGYGIRQDVFNLAENINGPSVKKIVQLCQETGKGVVFGMPRRDEKQRGNVYNSAVMVLPDGEVYVYDKWYLANFGPFEEMQFYKKGRTITVADTPWGKIGLIICFDLFFPELTKAYALAGADMVICISASPSATRKFFEKVLPARAIESTVFMLYSNVCGPDNNMVFWAGAQAYGPRGDKIARMDPFVHENLDLEIDLRDLDIARQNRPTLRDSRPEIFELILNEMRDDYSMEF